VGSVNQAGFTESGTSLFNLSVAQQNTTSVCTICGAGFGASFKMGGGRPLDISLRLGWMHSHGAGTRSCMGRISQRGIQTRDITK
jgi:hypothetical protein